VKVRAWTRPQNRKTVVLLDGLRATNDVSGWEHNTRVGPELAAKGVNVVQPVGGYMSFYSDWNAPDNFSKQGYTYKWNCVISKTLVKAMDSRGLRGPSGRYAIMGLSMSGSSAMIIAANNRRNFDAAGSLSGLLNLTAPGMREAIRAAMIFPMLDGGTPPMNADAMWGPPWSTRWLDNDPFVQINKMRGMKLFVHTGSGIPGYTATPAAILKNPALLIQGVPLEVLSSALTHVFDIQALFNRVPHKTFFPIRGLHDWPYWKDAIWNAYRQGFFRA
jgi:diacylglycerol O-acyltransferase/trehalose O-mycolyltransferase